MQVYRMTHAQSAVWATEDPDGDRIEEAIAEMLQAIDCPEDVLVEVDNGAVAFVLEMGRAL